MEEFEKEVVERLAALEVSVTNIKETVTTLCSDGKADRLTLENIKVKVAIMIAVTGFVSSFLSALAMKLFKV